jgi:hypothetical protein
MLVFSESCSRAKKKEAKSHSETLMRFGTKSPLFAYCIELFIYLPVHPAFVGSILLKVGIKCHFVVNDKNKLQLMQRYMISKTRKMINFLG